MSLAVQRRDDAGPAKVARVDRVRWRIDASSKVVHPNGMVDAWGVATRVGVFEYSDGPEAIREYVSDAELFAPDSLATMRGVPFTVQHPDGDVTADNARELTHGWVLEVRAKRDEGTVEALVRIATADALAAIEAGTVELSLGYDTVVEHVSGVSPQGEAYDAVQTKRRYNHLALVDIARVGHVARLRMDGVQLLEGDPMKKVKIKLADGRTIDVPEVLVPAWKAAAVDPKKKADALDPVEVTIAGEKLMLPQAMVDQLLALLGAPGASAEGGGSEPEVEPDVPVAAGTKVAAGKAKADAKGLDEAGVQALVDKGVGEAVAKLDADRRLDSEVRAKAGKVLPRGYGYAGSTWRIAADAIAHADEERKDAADALVKLADKGDARAQGRLLGMLETIERLADAAEDDDAPVFAFASAVAEGRGDAAEPRVDSLDDARAEQRKRKFTRKPAGASAAATK